MKKIILGLMASMMLASGAFAGQVVTIKCKSNGYKYHECYVDGRIEGAHLKDQLSSSDCNQGDTWGYFDNVVWVDNGCEGKFRVTYSDHGNGNGNGNGGHNQCCVNGVCWEC